MTEPSRVETSGGGFHAELKNKPTIFFFNFKKSGKMNLYLGLSGSLPTSGIFPYLAQNFVVKELFVLNMQSY